jgi:hypothetical protein
MAEIDAGLAAILAHAQARLDRAPAEGEEDVASVEPDPVVLRFAATAPAGLRELLEIGARHMHVDLGLWALWSASFPDGLGVEIDGELPEGFDPSRAIQIGGSSGGEMYVLLTWTRERYSTWIWKFEDDDVTEIGDFTRLLDWIRERTTAKARTAERIERVSNSALPALLDAAKLEAWSPD